MGGDLWWTEWNKDRFCSKYSRTPPIRINWDDKPSGYAEDSDNWIFFFKIAYIGSLKWGEKDSTNGCSRLHIYLRTKNTLIHNSLYVFDTWGGKTKTTKKDAVQFFSSSSLGAPTSFFECFGLLNI